MPMQRKISIETTSSENYYEGAPRAFFDPDPLEAKTQDQIFWTNYDTEAHWPGRLLQDGPIDKTYFMPNQIAPNGDSSSSFSPSTARTLTYACSLHPDEQGTIIVS